MSVQDSGGQGGQGQSGAGTSLEGGGRRPPYFINIEGREIPWPRPEIATEEVIREGGWDATLGAIMVDQHNNEQPLTPGQVIELTPGHSFSRRVRFKRGFERARRLAEELELIRTKFAGAELRDGWFWIPSYPVPPGWGRATMDIAFPVEPGYPTTRPYGLYVPSDLQHNGGTPRDFTATASNRPPFPGSWGVMSWQFRDEAWKPAADLAKGSTLLMFVESFGERLAEGT